MGMSTLTEGVATGGRLRIAAAKSLPVTNKSSNNKLDKSGQIYLEPGSFAVDGSFIFVRNPTIFELGQSYRMLKRQIGGQVAPLSVVQSVYAHNRLSWWTIHRSADAS